MKTLGRTDAVVTQAYESILVGARYGEVPTYLAKIVANVVPDIATANFPLYVPFDEVDRLNFWRYHDVCCCIGKTFQGVMVSFNESKKVSASFDRVVEKGMGSDYGLGFRYHEILISCSDYRLEDSSFSYQEPV